MVKLARDRLRGAVLAVASTCVLAGTLGSLARLGWWLELFSHFRPQYAAGLAACGIALFVMRKPGIGVAMLVLAAANGLLMLHYFLPQPAVTPAAARREFRVVLLNVYFRNRDYDAVLDYVRSTDPDVAVFLEVTPAWRDALGRLRDTLPYQAHAGDVLVAGREPLQGLRAVALSSENATALVFQATVSDMPLTVIGAHANWPLGPRIAASRNGELAGLADLARSASGPVLVLGDLNVTAFSPAFHDLLTRGRLFDCATGRGWHPTWPAWFPPLYMQIDHCLASAGVAVTSLATGPYVGSDHYPLEVTLRLPGAEDRRHSGFSASLAHPTYRR